MSVIQLKRTNKSVDSSADLSTLSGTPTNLEAGEMLWAFGSTENEGTGVLYIGDGDDTNHNPIPIGGSAYTSMLSPQTADTVTKLNSAEGSGTGASLVMGDGQNGGESVTIDTPSDLANSYSINLPSGVGATGNSTIITTNASGKVPALSSSGGVDGTSLATTSGGSITADAGGHISTTSGNIATTSGNLQTTSGTILVGGQVVVDASRNIAGASVDVSGAATAASFTADANGNISTSGTGSISTAGGSISDAGVVTGTSVTTTSDGAITAHGSGNISTTSGNIATTSGNISTGSGDITDGTLTISGGSVSGAVDVTTTGDVVIGGNLTVSGTTTEVSSTTITIDDNLLQLADNYAGAANSNHSGWVTAGSDGNAGVVYGGMIFDNSDQKFKALTHADKPTTKFNAAASAGTLVATIEGDVTGDVTGNADTATALETSRTIGMTGDVVWTSAGFDGSGNVTGTATIQNGVVDTDMLNADVKLGSLADAPDVPDAANQDNKVLTYVHSSGTLEWTGKGTTSGGTAGTGISMVADGSDATIAQINLLNVDDNSIQDTVKIAAGTGLTGAVSGNAGSEVYTLNARSDSDIEALVTKNLVDGLNVDAATIDTYTVAGNVDVAVPASADFGNHNNINSAISGSTATITLSDDGASGDAITLTAGNNISFSGNADNITIASSDHYDDDDADDRINAVVTETFVEDLFSGAELTDWTTNTGATIHSSNYTDTTYSAGNGIVRSGTTFAADLKADGGIAFSGVDNELALDLDGTAIAGTLAKANVTGAGDWDATKSTVDTNAAGWTTAKGEVDGAESTYSADGKLVQWGADGALVGSTGTWSNSGIIQGTTLSNGTISATTDTISSTGDITLDPANNDVFISIGNETITINADGITAHAGAGMGLFNFVSDGGEI